MSIRNFKEDMRNAKKHNRERYVYYENRMQPVKAAKKECISFLAKLGRNHKFLKWPIFIALVAFIFVYNLFYHALLNLRVQDKLARGLAIFMTFVLVITSVDLTAFALTGDDGEKSEEYYKLSTFTGDFEDIEVPFGTAVEDIEFPATIDAIASLCTMSEEPVEKQVKEKKEDEEDLATPTPTPTPTPTDELDATPTPGMDETPNPEAVETIAPEGEENGEAAGGEEVVPTETPESENEDNGDGSENEGTVIEETPSETPSEESAPVEEPAPVVEESQPETSNESQEQPASTETVDVPTEENFDELEEELNVGTIVEDNGDPDENENLSDTEIIESPENEIENAENIDENIDLNEDDVETDGEITEISYEKVIEESTALSLEVTWNCDEYDADTEGEYIFRPSLPETYDDKDIIYGEIEIPTIKVIVGEAKAIKLSTVVDGVEIVLEAQPGVFAPNVSLNATRVVNEAIENLINEKIEKDNNNNGSDTELNDYMAFDIVVLDKNGEEVQPKEVPGVDPSKAVTVTFKKIGNKIKEDGVAEDEQSMDVFYVDDNLENIETVSSAEDGNDVSFNPEHFSLYVCACTHTGYKTVTSWSALYSSFYQKEGTVNVRLGANITEGPLTGYSTEKGLYIGGSNLVANLDLNGHSLIGESGRNQVIFVTDKANFDLHDSVGGGSVTANDNNYAIRANGGSVFTIYGGTINNPKGSGTTVKVESGSYGNILGGNITGAGTGISSASSSYVTLSNATVSGHKKAVSTTNGSVEIQSATLSGYTEDGVYINNPSGGTVKIAGSTISGDSAYKTIGINCYAGNEFSLGSGVTMSNKNSDIYIDSYVAPENVNEDNKASTQINLTACPTNALSIAIGDMSISSGAVEFTKNYVTGAESKFFSSVSTSYDVWKATSSLFIGAQPDCNISATMKPVSVQFPNNASKVDPKAATVKIGSGEASFTTATSKVKYGATVTMTAAINNPEEYTFKGWYEGQYSTSATPISTSLTYVFVAKKVDETYTAVFQKKQFTVAVRAGDTNKGSVSLQNASGGAISGTSTTQDIGEKIKIVASGKTYNSKLYEFAQWNDGDKTSPRTITVKENVTYTAQYKLPDPDPNATGTLYAGVNELKNTSTISEGTKLLMLMGDKTVTAQGGMIAITTLPKGSARVEVVAKNKYSYNNPGGDYSTVDVKESGDGFDTCLGGYIKWVNDGYSYWCNGGYVRGAHPYHIYSYEDSQKFKAGNIKASLHPDEGGSIKLSDDQTKIVEANLDVKIGDYKIINIIFTDGDINYVNGDRTVSMDIGGVAFTYVLPEAQIGNKEYSDLETALKAAKNGETVYAVGQAVSEVTGYDVGGETEYVTVAKGVSIVNYDGSKFTTDEESKVTVDNNGIVTLISGTVTAYPGGKAESNVKVGADGGIVTSDVQITVTSKDDGNLVVIPETNTDKIVISPDGDPKHTVTYNGCTQKTEYGVTSGVLTNEDSVEITDGTQYELSVDLNGNETTVETSPTNSGKTIITKGENEGGDYLRIDSKAEHDDFIINTSEDNDTTFSTNTEETIIIVAPGNKTFEEGQKNEVILEKGSVDVSSGGEIQTKDGTVFKNTNEGGEKITVNADDTGVGSGEVSVPSGGSAEVTPPGQDPIYVSVPKAGEGQAENSPVVIKTNDEGGVTIEADAGSPITIQMPDEDGKPGEPVTYNTGDFETVIDIVVGNDGEPQVVVSDGSVILEPGQSITDANGVTFTNPPTEEGQEPKPITLNITEGEPTSVQTEGGGNFEYQLPGDTEPRQFDNPSAGGATFDVTTDGDVSLNSDVEFQGGGSGAGVTVSTGEGDTEVKPDSENKGKVKVDTTENTITVEKEGDKVTIGGQTYETTDDKTVIKVGDDGPELISGGVVLTEGEDIIVNGTDIKADGDGVYVETDPEKPENIKVKVEEGGAFSVEQPGNSSTAVEFTNNTEGEEATYEIDPSGGVKIPADTETVCKHGDDEIIIKPSSDDVTVTPSTDGVSVTTPKKGEGETEPTSVDINGKTYVNESENSDLVLAVDGDDVILKQGEVTVPEGGDVTLYNGDVITVNGGTATVDDTGNIEVPENGEITIKDNKGENVIKSLEEDTKILIDPETGNTVLKDGSVELGKGSNIQVVYDTEIIKDGDVPVDTIDKTMVITSTGDNPPKIVTKEDGTADVEVPAGGAIRIESATEGGGTATNVVKVPATSEGGVQIETQTDGSIDATLGKNETVSVNGNEYTARENDTEINVGPKGATLEEGSVALDPGESINAGGSNVKNSGAKGTEVVISSEEKDGKKTTTIEAPKGGKFTLSEEGSDKGYTFTNPSNTSEEYTVNDEGNLVLEDGSPIKTTINGKEVEISGGEDSDVELKVTKDGINLTTDKGNEIKVGQNSIINDTPEGSTEKFNVVVDSTGDIILDEGEAKVPTGSVVNVTDDKGNKTKVENKSNPNSDTEIKLSDDGEVEIKYTAPTEGEPDPSSASVTVTDKNGKKNTYSATDENPVVIDTTPENGGTPVLESGSVELSGGKDKSSIVVNGLSVTNEGTGDGVSVSKDATTGATELSIEPGSEFGLSAPGQEDKAYKFSNPSIATGPANYEVDEKGNIDVKPGSSIEFTDSKGNKSVVMVEEKEGQNPSKITVDEDGVKITTDPGKNVNVNGTSYLNHDSTKPLVLSIDENKDTVLEEGTTGLLPGEEITIKSGDPTKGEPVVKTKVSVKEDPSEPSDKAAVIKDDGTIDTTNEEKTFIFTDEKGNKNEVTAEGKLKVSDDGVSLEEGTATVPQGSEVIVNGSVIKNTGDKDSTVSVTKTTDPSTGKEVTEFELSDGASFAMGAPGSKNTVEFSNPEGSTEVSKFTLDDDGNIELAPGSSLQFEVNGEPVVISVDEHATTGSGVKVTEDGVTFDIPAGGSVEIGGVEYKNDGTTPLNIAINKDGKPVLVEGTIDLSTLPADEEIYVKDKNGNLTPVKAEDVPEGKKATVTTKTKEDGTVETTVEAPKDSKVTIGDNEYKVTDDAGAKIKTDDAKGTPLLESGTVDVAEGDEIAVTTGTAPNVAKQVITNKGNSDPEKPAEETNISISSNGTVNVPDGTKLDISNEDGKDSGEGVKVTTDAGSTIEVNGGTYKNNDSTGEFTLDVNGSSGEVELEKGKNVEVTNGNITVGDTTISTTGDQPVSITDKGKDTKGNPIKPDITVEPGGNVTIGSTDKEGAVEVKIPADTEEEKKISIDSTGNITVPVKDGEQVTVGGITYTAGKDGKIVVNGETGSIDDNKTNVNPTNSIDPESFNQPNYSYKVPAGTTVDVGGVKYVAPKEGMTLLGNEDGNPIIQVTNAGSTVTVGDQKITTGSKNTQFVVNDDGSLELIDNGSEGANSSVTVTGNSPVSVDGNKYTGSNGGGYTVTYSDDGDVVTAKDGSSVTVNVGKDNKVVLGDVTNEKGENIVITSTSDKPTSVVVDKTTMDAKGSYEPQVKAQGNTKLTPVYDEEGNLIGYEAEYKAPAPVPPKKDDPPYYPPATPTPAEDVPVVIPSATPKATPSATPAAATPAPTVNPTRTTATASPTPAVPAGTDNGNGAGGDTPGGNGTTNGGEGAHVDVLKNNEITPEEAKELINSENTEDQETVKELIKEAVDSGNVVTTPPENVEELINTNGTTNAGDAANASGTEEAAENTPVVVPVAISADDMEALVAEVLTDDEKVAVLSGETLTIFGALSETTDEIAPEVKDEIEKTVPEGMKPASYMDFTIYKKIGDDVQEIEGRAEVWVTYPVPEKYRNPDTDSDEIPEYVVMRVYTDENGVTHTELVSASQNGYELSFLADNDSQYILVASELALNKAAEETPEIGELTKNEGTNEEGGCTNHWWLLGTTALYFAALTALRNKKKAAKLGLAAANTAAAVTLTCLGDCSYDKFFLAGNLLSTIPALNIIKSKDGEGVVDIDKDIINKALYGAAGLGVATLLITSIASVAGNGVLDTTKTIGGDITPIMAEANEEVVEEPVVEVEPIEVEEPVVEVEPIEVEEPVVEVEPIEVEPVDAEPEVEEAADETETDDESVEETEAANEEAESEDEAVEEAEATVDETVEETETEEVEAETETEVEDTAIEEPATDENAEETAEEPEVLTAATSTEIEVASGMDSRRIANMLEDAGVIPSAKDFDWYLCINGYDTKMKVGHFEIPEGATEEEMAKILTKTM